MHTTRSADGTSLAYEVHGSGEPLIIIDGATCDRSTGRPLAEAIAPHLRALVYDRCGRGDSEDHAQYEVEREVEDLAALIEAFGGTTSLYGRSCGAALAIHAAAAGLPIDRLVLHDPPYMPSTDEGRRTSREYADRLGDLLNTDRRGEAISLYLNLAGRADEAFAAMHGDDTEGWERLEDIAHTLAYDAELVGHDEGGGVPHDVLERIRIPTLVLVGDANPEWFVDTAREVAESLIDARLIVIPGHGTKVPPPVLVPHLVDFLLS